MGSQPEQLQIQPHGRPKPRNTIGYVALTARQPDGLSTRQSRTAVYRLGHSNSGEDEVLWRIIYRVCFSTCMW